MTQLPQIRSASCPATLTAVVPATPIPGGGVANKSYRSTSAGRRCPVTFARPRCIVRES